jgi:UDP-N-acetylmuramoylalanine--D-glutamate ligase
VSATPAAPHAELAGKRVLVMGLGAFGGGLGAARYLAGIGCRVRVTDLRPADALAPSLAGLAGLGVETVLGCHRREDFERCDLVVVNPAVRPDDALLAVARDAGARLASEIELFLEAVDARIACVTGTQGKSSTCHLAAGLLRESGVAVHAGGNLGGSLLEALARIEPTDRVVLELSSYQLAALERPAVARGVEVVAITNVLADHLERHGSREAYAAAKRRVLEMVADGGAAILPAGDPALAEWRPPRGRRIDRHPIESGEAARGLTLAGGRFRLDGEELARAADLALPGDFQRENALVALGIARLLGAPAERLGRALGRQRGLEHRLEDLGLFRGRRVHDNGVSTTPDSTVSALRALPSGCILIAGGRAKALPLDELARVAAERARLVLAFGEAAPRLASELGRAGARAHACATLAEAVQAAFLHSRPGDELLFSPACASFDAYGNFRERAQAFRALLPPAE